MSSRTVNRIAVLLGGPSAEREVSLVSGRECAVALREEGFEVVEIDAGQDLAARLLDVQPDVVFNALHGRWGEDGCVQGLLEWLRIPYTHSGVLASSLAMDKERSKRTFANANLPIAKSILVDRVAASNAHPMDPPYVVKPNNEGSSVGVHIVLEGDDTQEVMEAFHSGLLDIVSEEEAPASSPPHEDDDADTPAQGGEGKINLDGLRRAITEAYDE